MLYIYLRYNHKGQKPIELAIIKQQNGPNQCVNGTSAHSWQWIFHGLMATGQYL